jgi:hypothetical protein
MTDRERAFANLGLAYAEGIERASRIELPNGRLILRTPHGWEVQPWNENYYRIFTDLLDAVRFATPPSRGGVADPSQFAEAHALAAVPYRIQ